MAHGICQTRNPKAVPSPLRSIPFCRRTSAIFRPTERPLANNALFIARRDLPRAEASFVTACPPEPRKAFRPRRWRCSVGCGTARPQTCRGWRRKPICPLPGR